MPAPSSNLFYLDFKYDNDIPATIPYNRLTFNYRTDESPYSWQEAYSEALSIKRRLPTINELKLYITNYPSIFTQWNNLDYWTPVINPLYTNGKDWVQIGNNVNHVRGKSHAQETGGYPSWGDNSTSDYSKIYFDVFDTLMPKLLTFSYRTDESPYSWQEAYDEAITNSRRIPTIIELREYITNYPNVFTQWNNLDYWTPVINLAYANSKDWVQIGNNATHIRGKSYTEALGYPSWGDSTTNDSAKIYFEVIETYLNTHFVTFEPGTQVEINEDKFLTLDNEYIISLSNTSALVRKIINNTIENTNTINTINNINTINTINTTNNIIYNVTNKNFITMKYSNMKDTNKYAIERMYPPLLARNFTSTTTIVSGQSYGNGTYVVTGSSIFHTGQLQIIPVDYTHPCNCFNESNTIGGHWAITNYDTSFNYVPTNKIIESFDDGLYYGEWLKIKLPIAIKLTKYSIKQRLEFSSNSPGKFRIYGSNNDIDWVLLIDRTSSNITYINGLYTEITFNIYSEYIFFVLVVGSTLSSRILNFDEWYLYGDEITNIIEPVVTPGITSIERMYPPLRDFTAATRTITGQSYGNGTYIVSSSSEYDSVNQSKFNIFNGTNQGWTQQSYSYGGTPAGTYTGSFSLAGYSGEWVKVQLPVPINLTRYIIEANNIGGTSRVPAVYKIFGSNDNINWVELVNKSNPLVVADYVSSKYEEKVSTSNYYRYFALVVNKNMGLDIWLSIGEWYIYGKESYDVRTFVHSGGSENQTSHSITFEQNTLCDILIVGGGGGGGYFGGGGGGGSILFATNIILNGTCTIKTGKGGTGAVYNIYTQNGINGQDSSITINGVEYIAKGGGGGGTRDANSRGVNGNNGGSGGGGSGSNDSAYLGTGGISNKNTYTGWLSYGNNGAKGRLGIAGSSPIYASGGGGGAGSAGGDISLTTGGGNGGSGLNFSSIFGTSVGHSGWFGGGGGGNTYQDVGNPGYGNGGNGLFGGGGNGGFDGTTDISAQDGLPNTGGGGGGSKWDGGTAEDLNGGHGGSGIVIIRMKSNVGAATTIGNPVSQELLTFNYVPRYPFVDKSLLLHYKFDELGNGEGYLDSSGNGYNLTAKAGNIPVFSRLNYVLGRAAFENGSSGSTLVIPNEVGSQLRAINIATGISLSFWFNLSITNQKDNWADILCFMVGTDANKRGIIIGQQTTDAILTSSTDPTTWISSSNRLFVGMQDGATNPYGYVGKGKLDREWHHFVWTITTAGVWAIYIDNVLQTYENVNQSTSGIIPNYSYTTNEFFGGSQVGHNNGYIDDFRIYKGVLTTAEITTLYNINSPEYPKIPADNANLKAWYKFDDEGNNEGYLDSNPSITKHNLIIPSGSPPSSTPIFSSIQKIFGKSAYEGGVEARIQFPTSLTNQLYTINNTNGISFSLWYNMSTSSGSSASLFEFSETAAETTNTRRFGIAREGLNNQIGLFIKDYIAKPTDYYYLGNVGSGTVNNVWHHIVWSISSTGVWTCYVDNVNQNINVTGKIPNITNYNFSYILGSIQSTQTFSYVDDFRIYDKVLSETEVSMLYHVPYVNNINTYTINFPVDTIANINDNTDYIFKGKYDINLTSLYSHIVPKENQKLGIITKFPTSTMKIKYNIYNPVNKLLLEPYVNNDNFYNGYVYENYNYTGTLNTAKYYKTFTENTICDILVVGGGGSGGGAGGSGGGGAVVEFLNVNIPAGDYVINVGRGGQNAAFAESSSVSGNNGNTSSFIGNNIDIKAAGGGGGSSYMTNNATTPPSVNYINPLTNTTQTSQGGGGGCGGNGQMAVAYVMNLTLSGRGGGNPYSGQTWTAGAGGGAAPASLGGNGGDSYTTSTAANSLGFLGNGGKGIISAITNMEYGGGAAGSRWNATANNTIYGYATGGGGTCVLNGLNSTIIPADNGRGGGGYGDRNGGSGIVILRYRQYNPGSNLNNQKKLNFNYIPDTIVYDFTRFNNLADWKAFATSIGATTSFETYLSDEIWFDSEKLGFIRLPLTNYLYDNVTITYKNGHTSGAVKIYINGIEKSSCAANETKTYTQKYVPGDILRVEEGFAELGANLIIILSNANIVNRYNINFPVNTSTDFNKENKSVILRGNYNIVNLPTSTSITTTSSNDDILYNKVFSNTNIDLNYNTTIATSNIITEPSVMRNINPENILTFTNNGLVNTQTYMQVFEQDTLCDILIVGGGGGGGCDRAGGGGAGGLVFQTEIILSGIINISVGRGGDASVNDTTTGSNGFASSIGSIIALGGGGGGSEYTNANNGGSGGGSAYNFSSSHFGSGDQPTSSSGGYGNRGGDARDLVNTTFNRGTGGGGGAGTRGLEATSVVGGAGGDGLAGVGSIDFKTHFNLPTNNTIGHYISGENKVYFAGGGGGGDCVDGQANPSPHGIGGKGGGANGNTSANIRGTALENSGGGGGGGNYALSLPIGSKGGSGIVIIRINRIVTTGILDGITHKKISFNYLFDKTAYNEYMAQYYTGGSRWRLVRYLPPTSTTWYPINDNLTGTTTTGTAYDYSSWWSLPFGNFDEFVFATFNMKYWLHVTRVQAIGTNYDNSPRTILRSSISNIPYTANWYNRAANGEDPWIGLRTNSTAPVNNPEAGGDLILYGENSTTGHVSNPAISKDGGMCVFVRDSGISTETHPLQSYEINFPVKTLADVNNTGVFSLVEGKYDINIGTFSSSITPKEGQYLQKPNTFTYNIPEERMYPPVRNFIASSMFISGLSYGNGLYNVKYSTFRDTTEPFQLFNENNTTGGHWEEVTKYDTTTGIYIGTDSLGGYSGDWVTIQLPVAIRMTRYMFKQRPDVTNGSPRNFRIYGSNDGSTWVQLINKTDITYLNLYYNETNILLNGYYSYYGLVVNATIGNRSQLNFDEWYIYGYEMPMSALELRYQLLNPVKDPIGAQWTYNSSNINVYHMGNVGIGTKLPEYSLHVDGYIYTSATAYTSSTKTKWTTVSDRRIKENIVKASYEKCLENVRNIELYRFNLNNNVITNDKNQLGFIAQEVQKIYPKAVEANKIIDKNNLIPDLLTLNTTQIDYTLFGAVKELINKVENIGKKIENITKENEPNIEDNQNILSTPPITNISLEELKDLK
jgi:hypothetical protein